ncbi:MAG: lysine decarboxylase, partial [Acidobacteriota bacterium]|nr:lysine decarboxylase [Acidobacteriota bacterium]
TILLYGTSYWKEILNFDALVKYGVISAEDLKLFEFVDDPQTAMESLKNGLAAYAAQAETMELPAITPTVHPTQASGR